MWATVSTLGATPPRPSAAAAWLRPLGWAVAVMQAVVFVVWSYHLYARFDLTTDFGIFYQAWHQIAHGDLSPYLTLNPHNYPHYGYPFWKDHFELIVWPLALLWFVSPHAIDLLWVQDLATAGSTLVAFLWVVDILGRHWNGPRWEASTIATGSLAVLVLNPWVWWSVSFDFHVQALATLFSLLAARDLWWGRKRAWLWIGVVMLCGNVSATYLIGVGITYLLLGSPGRERGAAIVGLGVAWSALIGAIGGSEGTLISNYSYLAHERPGQTVGVARILGGIVSHPSTPVRMLRSRLHTIYDVVASAGLVGIVAPIGLGIGLVVLVTNELNGSPVFSSPDSAFQSLPLYFFVLVGTVSGLTWLALRPFRYARLLAGALGLVLLAQSLALSAIWLPRARTAFTHVDPAAASELARVSARVPSSAEVVASQGVIGRFSGRRLAYPFVDIYSDGQTLPVFGRDVVFVLTPSEGIEYATPEQTLRAVRFVRSALHARPLAASAGVYAFRWTPPPGTTSVTLPK